MFIATTATSRILNLKKRIRAIQGGTAASKTISILLVLIDMAQSDTTPTLTSIVSESIPHLKRGAMRDFLAILEQHKYFSDSAWNRTDFIYTFPNGSRIEFFGADSPDKVRGPRRDRLFLNEANNVSQSAFDQLEVRTKELIFLDWNPTNEYWFYTDILPTRQQDIDHITLTYKDNEALDPAIVQSIESRQNNRNWWQVYGLGQLGEVESRVYTGWQVIDAVPHEARLERRGLDFGYTNDPTAIVDLYWYNGSIVIDERLYRKGMSNRDIADAIRNAPNPSVLVKADSAEPKSIDEIRSYGVNIVAAQKGPDSIRQGIQYLRDQKVSVTKQSTNLIKEYHNYLYETDKDGKILNVPIGIWNHCLDAVRYGVENWRESDPLFDQKLRHVQRLAEAGEFV